MPCLIVLIAFFFPRFVLVVLAVTTNYLSTAYQTWLWPVLGFFFMPYTTLAYAWAQHVSAGRIGGLPLLGIIIAVLIDIGVVGGGRLAGKKK
jgi:hypothetical protein